MQHKCNILGAAILMTASTMAATWHVSTAVTDGMSGPEQITNAIARLASGDTILVEPGTYDFTGIYMMEDTHLTRAASAVSAGPVKTFSIIGNATGHWSDEIVFTGDKRFGSFEHQSAATTWRGPYPLFQNITFQGFASSSNHGGCLKFALWNTMTANQCWPIVSNCVFKTCAVTGSNLNGGAIYGAVQAYDCKFSDCTATGSGGAIALGAAYNSSFEKNSATRGGAVHMASDETIRADISNCVFTANNARSDVGGAIYGNAAFLGRVFGCVFKDNSAKNGGGACGFGSNGMADFWNSAFSNNCHTVNNLGGGAVLCQSSFSGEIGFHNCQFVENTATGASSHGGAVRDGGFFEGCAFIGNMTTNANGGALYFSKTGGIVSNCVFLANESVKNGSYYPLGGAISGTTTYPVLVMDSAFTNNVGGWNAGAISYGTLERCRFKCNHSPAAGGAIFSCTAMQCSFDGDYGTMDYQNAAAIADSKLFDCDVSASIYNTRAARCKFHDVNFTQALAVFYQKNWVTNSLVARCGENLRGIVYSYGNKDVESEFVNCTFADNYADGSCGLFTSRSNNGRNPVKLVNCILSGNTNALGIAQDVSGENVAAGDVKLQKCMYGSAESGFPWVDVESSCVQKTNPGFLDPKQLEELNVPAYSLKNTAAARGLGLSLGWTAADTDLAGNPRIRDGKVDLGCYQCWTNPNSFIIVVR